ncbi:MAG: hypothetical protein J6Y91_02080 [Alphaproteobacteria bacterium]|nr:hypothetical protein [Alphaproteobacteria bacterium]
MSELREELERHLHEYEQREALERAKATSENSENQPTTDENTATTVVVIQAPEGYSEQFAADFANLSPAWQEYLSQREHELAEQLTAFREKLQRYAGLENIYADRAEHLQKLGLSCIQDWLEGLAVLDAAMENNPQQTLALIASCYGLGRECPPPRCSEIPAFVFARLGKLERDYADMSAYLHHQKSREQEELIRMFAAQKDADGQPQHPYFDELKPQVLKLLDNGTAFDVADAYEKAKWLNPFVREELIKAKISSQSAEAQKAKKASFAPKGKAEAPEKELTLREEIQKNMAAFIG